MEKNKLLPQNAEAEAETLGCLLLDAMAIERVKDFLQPKHFSVKRFQTVYRACLSLHSEKKPINAMMVSDWLESRGLIESVSGDGWIWELQGRLVSSVNVDQYAKLICQKAKDRELIELGDRISELGFDPTLNTEQKLSQVEAKIIELNNVEDCDSFAINEIGLTGWFDELNSLMEGDKNPTIPSGFYDLDEMLGGGFELGEFVVVGGRPSMGKTALVTAIMINLAASGHPVVMFSMEMTRNQIYNRIAAADCGIKYSQLKNGRLTQNELEQLTSKLGEWMEYPQAIDDASSHKVSPVYIRSRLKRFEALTGQPAKCVILDYLQLLAKSDNFNNELTKLASEFKAIAKDFNLVFLCLAQLNRGVEQRTNKRPTMSDIRDSGSIEQAADSVILLYRDEYYNSETRDAGIAELIVAKNRNGATGTVKLLFDGEYARFRNIAKPKF